MLEFYICTGDAMIKRSASGDDSKSKRRGRNMGGRLARSQEAGRSSANQAGQESGESASARAGMGAFQRRMCLLGDLETARP